MSMLSIDCFEQRSLRLLKRKLQGMQQRNQRICNVCNRTSKSQNSVLINYEVAGVYDRDIVYVCGKCSQSKSILRNEPKMQLGCIVAILTILTDKDLRSLSREVVKEIVSGIRGMNYLRKYRREELAEMVVDALDGFDQQYQQYTVQYQNLSIRACDQIKEFYESLCRSKMVRYCGLNFGSSLIFDSRFQQYLREYVEKQMVYKLQILRDMQVLTRQVREWDYLWGSVGRMLRALQEYGLGFEKRKDVIHKVVYSISRTAIQRKHVQGYYEMQQIEVEQKSKLMVRMETCFGVDPVVFKITVTSLMEFVELGVCFTRKIACQQKIVRAVLIKLQVRSEELSAEQIACNKEVERGNTKKSKIMGVSYLQDESWQLSGERSSIEGEDYIYQNGSRQGNTRHQGFLIQSGDEISVSYDNRSERLRICNLSENLQLLSKDLWKMGKFVAYPCVRLVSYNCRVERVVQQ